MKKIIGIIFTVFLINIWCFNLVLKQKAIKLLNYNNSVLDLSNKNLSDQDLEDILNNTEIKDKSIINLNNNNLTKIPDKLLDLNIKSLDLSNNKIRELPDIDFSELQYLYLANNQLEKLPEFIGKLQYLKVLVLNNNLLLELPDFSNNFIELDFLDISFNDLNISSLPGYYKYLAKKIYLHGNRFKLKDVQDYNIGCKFLVNIPRYKLENMLDSSSNPINLSSLNLNYFDLVDLVDLYVNKYENNKTVWERLSNIKNLRLDFSDNFFNSLDMLSPILKNLKNLIYLKLSYNRLHDFILTDIDFNSLNLKNLKTLDLDNNLLTTVSVRGSNGNRLENMNLSSNINLSDIYLNNLNNLKSLEAINCGLTSIPDLSGTKLEHLNLGFNKINKISKNLSSLTGLQEIYLNNNQISKVPENLFNNLTKLRILNLSHNPLNIESSRLIKFYGENLLRENFNKYLKESA